MPYIAKLIPLLSFFSVWLDWMMTPKMLMTIIMIMKMLMMVMLSFSVWLDCEESFHDDDKDVVDDDQVRTPTTQTIMAKD